MRRVVCGVAGALLLANSGLAVAPEGRFISHEELREEAEQHSELEAYLERNGMPEAAEVKVLADRPPWDDHEVTLYYLDERREISFARALSLGEPDIPVIRYERDLTDADVEALRSMSPEMTAADATAADGAMLDAEPVEEVEEIDWEVASVEDVLEAAEISGSPAERAEAAADRAELAAGRVEVAADRTEKAATRAELAVERLSATAGKSRR